MNVLKKVYICLVLMFLLMPVAVVTGVSFNEKKALFFPPVGFSVANSDRMFPNWARLDLGGKLLRIRWSNVISRLKACR